MARKSRGASLSITPSNSSCPSSIALTLDTSNPDDWGLTWTWLPAVLIPTLTVEYSTDGITWSGLTSLGNQNSGDDFFFDPNASFDPTVLTYLRALGSDIDQCPDTGSNTVEGQNA